MTGTDAYSRYLLRCQAVAKRDTEGLRAIFEAAFREYGLPAGGDRTDKGWSFAQPAVGGLWRLAVWWMEAGDPSGTDRRAAPEQNGEHERMHRRLKQETAMALAENRRAQQPNLDRFRQEYNKVGPNEGLQMQTRANVYGDAGAQCAFARALHFRWKKRGYCPPVEFQQAAA